jgi:hypothetical protein
MLLSGMDTGLSIASQQPLVTYFDAFVIVLACPATTAIFGNLLMRFKKESFVCMFSVDLDDRVCGKQEINGEFLV